MAKLWGSYEEMLGQVAAHLTGLEVVIVRLQKPGGYSGLACKGLKGEAKIFLDPLVREPEFFRIFCHECAHLVKDFAGMKPGASWYTPVSLTMEQKIAHKAEPDEIRANDYADKWICYAEQNQAKYSNWGTLAPLRALLNYDGD